MHVLAYVCILPLLVVQVFLQLLQFFGYSNLLFMQVFEFFVLGVDLAFKLFHAGIGFSQFEMQVAILSFEVPHFLFYFLHLLDLCDQFVAVLILVMVVQFECVVQFILLDQLVFGL